MKESKRVVPIQKINSLKMVRVWLVASNWRHDGGLDEQSESVKKYFDENMSQKLAKNINGIWIYLYEK
jgi:hypothetical protein